MAANQTAENAELIVPPALTGVTEKLLAYALGRRLEYYDRPMVRKIVRDAATDDYRWSSLILGIVKSPTFLMRASQVATN